MFNIIERVQNIETDIEASKEASFQFFRELYKEDLCNVLHYGKEFSLDSKGYIACDGDRVTYIDVYGNWDIILGHETATNKEELGALIDRCIADRIITLKEVIEL